MARRRAYKPEPDPRHKGKPYYPSTSRKGWWDNPRQSDNAPADHRRLAFIAETAFHYAARIRAVQVGLTNDDIIQAQHGVEWGAKISAMYREKPGMFNSTDMVYATVDAHLVDIPADSIIRRTMMPQDGKWAALYRTLPSTRIPTDHARITLNLADMEDERRSRIQENLKLSLAALTQTRLTRIHLERMLNIDVHPGVMAVTMPGLRSAMAAKGVPDHLMSRSMQQFLEWEGPMPRSTDAKHQWWQDGIHHLKRLDVAFTAANVLMSSVEKPKDNETFLLGILTVTN